VDVSQFLDKLLLRPNVEVVIPRLPKVFAPLDQPSRNRLLQSLYRHSERASFRLANQQMNMLRHDDISADIKTVALTNSFESMLDHDLGLGRGQEWQTVVAAEGYEVQMMSLLIAL